MARPRVPDHLKVRTPTRQVGKVKDETWETIQEGYRLSGEETFTNYAVKLLLKETKRQKRLQRS